MTETIYGYVRVSTQEQHEARQLDAMRKFGVAEQNIIVEKVSGKDFNRPLYQQLVKKLRPEDVLVVKSIDRLGRNYDEILEQWGVITKKTESRHCGVGYAPAGYPAGARLNRDPDLRHCTPASQLCGPIGA